MGLVRLAGWQVVRGGVSIVVVVAVVAVCVCFGVEDVRVRVRVRARRDVEKSMRAFNEHVQHYSSVKLDAKLEDGLE